MNARRIYFILIPLGCINLLYYLLWNSLYGGEPALIQYSILQMAANGIAAAYIVKHARRDVFY